MLIHYRITAALVFSLFYFQPGNEVHADFLQKIYSQETDKPLEAVLEDTEFAITERNLRITGRLHIGNAIRERGNTDFPPYEIILYCSIDFAEKIIGLLPDSILACPGRVFIMTRNGKYIISATLWPEDMGNGELMQHMQLMNQKVREIVDFAAKDWLFINEK